MNRDSIRSKLEKCADVSFPAQEIWIHPRTERFIAIRAYPHKNMVAITRGKYFPLQGTEEEEIFLEYDIDMYDNIGDVDAYVQDILDEKMSAGYECISMSM